MGEGSKGRGGGSHNVCCIPKNNLPQLSHVSRQEGIKSGLFSPSLLLCSPLMPPNQPGGDMIILEPGVTVARTPGAGSSVCECVYMYVCFCTCVYKAAGVALATSSLCESAAACSNMHPELPTPVHFLCLSPSLSLTQSLAGSWCSVGEEGKKKTDPTYLWIVSVIPQIAVCSS